MKLFVYGTLKDRARARGGVDAFIHGNIYDLGPYPAIRLGGNGVVHGLAYEVDEKELRELDRYEGVPTLYTREQTTAVFDDGREELVWVYQFARPLTCEPIKSGIWG